MIRKTLYKVKIISAPNNNVWYAARVGDEYLCKLLVAEDKEGQLYVCFETDMKMQVPVQHCQILEAVKIFG